MICFRHAVALGIVTIFGGLGACASGTDSPVDPADADGDEEVGSAQSDLTEAEALVDWDIRAAEEESGTVFSTVYYAVHNRTNGDFLQQTSSLGVNLDFGATPTEDFTFRLASGPGTVRFGDKVAIGVRTRGFLAYGAQVAGIWLHFEDSPAYEWRIYGGPVDAGPAEDAYRPLQHASRSTSSTAIAPSRAWRTSSGPTSAIARPPCPGP